MKRIWYSLLLTALFGQIASAQIASETATASVPYSGVLGADERLSAIELAKQVALDTYVARLGQPSLSQIYEANKEDIYQSLNTFVLSHVQLSYNQDKKTRTYSVTIRAEINQSNLTNFVTQNYSVNSGSVIEKSPISFIFVSRELASRLSFDDEVSRTNRVERNDSSREESKTSAQQSQQIANVSVGLREGSVTRRASRSEEEASQQSGGQILQRSSESTYRVRSSLEFDTAVTAVLSSSGYEVVEAGFVEGLSNGMLNLEQIRTEFATGTDIQSSTLLNIANAFKQLEIPYFAMGAMDVGAIEQDNVTGSVRVNVSITGKIYDFQGRFPITVSSVGPVVFSGRGSDQLVATNNALQSAAETLGEVISQELSARQVR